MFEYFKNLPRKEQVELVLKLWDLIAGGHNDSFKTEHSDNRHSEQGQTNTGLGQPSCDCER